MNIFSCAVFCNPSSAIRSSSYNFSPGRSPVYSILISSSGLSPDNFIKFRARSSIRIGSPISSTKISPPLAYAPACNTRDTASGIVIKYRIIFLSVTVTGPPSSICFRNRGITLPLLPNTFPKRTATNSVLLVIFNVCMIISQILLEAPIIFVGLTALSVDISIKRLHPFSDAALAVFSVPNTLFLIASLGLLSINGTCL